MVSYKFLESILKLCCCFFTVPSSPPGNISVFVIDSTSIQVNWTEVPEIDQNGIITHYEVTYEPLTTFDIVGTFTLNTTNTSITLMNLEEYVEYNISVRAYTSVGPGPYGLTSAMTLEDGNYKFCLN